MKNILIVGAGNLGRRHLQSLAAFREPIFVQVLDMSDSALNEAKQLFDKSSPNSCITVEYISDFNKIISTIDIAIIATSSLQRRDAITLALEKSTISNLILEKFLFTEVSQYADVGKLLSSKNVNAWVNCPRRMYPFYNKLKAELKGPISMNVIGSNWGLACNSIHFLDLHYFLSDRKDLIYKVNVELLHNEIYSSKRPGYIEFMGSLVLGGNDGSRLDFTCNPTGSSPVSINIECSSHKIYISEGTPGKLMIARENNGWKWEIEEFYIKYQSELTYHLLDSLFSYGECNLPNYGVSEYLHTTLLKAFLDKSRRILNDKSINECLIT